MKHPKAVLLSLLGIYTVIYFSVVVFPTKVYAQSGKMWRGNLKLGDDELDYYRVL